MRRTVSTRLELEIRESTELVLQVAVAAGTGVEESLEAVLDGTRVQTHEIGTAHGGRAHGLEARPGTLVVSYEAVVSGDATPLTCTAEERLVYLRPSRYAESDRLAEVARRLFGGLAATDDIVAGVSSWVGTETGYEAGSSLPTHGALDTLLGGQGVCRDFAHLVVALLRARDVPARVAAVYAPGLSPMDFHAVAEALVDGDLAGRRRDASRTADVARADRDRARRSGYGVPDGDRRDGRSRRARCRRRRRRRSPERRPARARLARVAR